MKEPEDVNNLSHLLVWNERLPLLAKAQSDYMSRLTDQGFDSEQAFTLVRDWSQHAWYWSTQPPEKVEDPLTTTPEVEEAE